MSTAAVSSRTASNQLQQRNARGVISQDRHAASADAATPHVPALKKSRRNTEASAQHVSTPSAPSSTLINIPFDARSILPQSKPQKSLSKLMEASSSSNKHTRSQTYSFECIDGAARTFDYQSSSYSLLAGQGHPAPDAKHDAPSASEKESHKEQFTAFGIEAFPTRAVLNELCYDFVSTKRWCPHGYQCNRIHPLNKYTFLSTVIQESVRFQRMKHAASAMGSGTIRPPEDPVHDKRTRGTVVEPNPSSLNIQPSPLASQPVRVRLPTPTPLPQTSSSDIAPVSRRHPTQSSDNKVRPQEGDTERWNGGSDMRKTPWGNRAPSDTSSSSNDSEDDRATPFYPSDPHYWEAHTEDSAWCSDSDDAVKEAPTPPASKHSSPAAAPGPPKHPRPKNNERCRNWLRDRCSRGYNCQFVHDDLDYDDDEPDPPKQVKPDLSKQTTSEPGNTPKGTVQPSASERPIIRQPPTSLPFDVHTHMHLRLGPGFVVDDLTTGFESRWIFVDNLPKSISDVKLNHVLRLFGDVVDIRRPTQPHLLNPLTVKVEFSKAAEAYKAFTTLHNSVQFGRTLECRMSVNTKAGGAFIKDTAVRIDWEAPFRTVYMGYASEELAQQAVEKARHTSIGDYLPTAGIHIGIPAVGRVTVKFVGVPIDVTEEGMEIFGAHQGMVSQRPNYNDYMPGNPNYNEYSVQDTVKGVKKLLHQFHGKAVEVDVRPPPYREGKMRVWAYFSTPDEAQKIAQNLHNRKPAFVGRTRIMARHLKTISFTLAPYKFQKAAVEIKALAEQVWRQGGGYSLSITDKQTSISLRLCGEDMKVLSRLKAELERMLNGEPLLENGKSAWDDFFGRSSGVLFLLDLEREYAIKIDKDIGRRSIRLFGLTENRKRAAKKILQKMAQLRSQQLYIIQLDPRLTAALLNGDYQSLPKKLGPDNVMLDLWKHILRIRGDVDAYNFATDLVNSARSAQQKAQNHRTVRPAVECPVCFDEVSSPVKLACGHSWCRSCMQRYLLAAVEQKFFPLTCLGNGAKCTERIPLLTARDLLKAGDLEAVVYAAFSAHVQTHPDEYHFCPTPDCKQVYRPAPEGVFIQCPSCLVRICPNCHTDAHDGLTCMESTHGDDLFRDWVDNHNVKRCPGCNMAIEKEEGCNHMVCTMCKTHSCWVCLQTFQNGDGIYGHMRSEHGDFGLGPIYP
ncbi:hypothetical protein GALMADRAFT_146415 [Galerina marginata CBS 339.88]|uniref:RING-type E3 ubiquitin transferase n=1 Tax=Galerina marginata (strain CBS 339.88) TaxID=685588 RepID=A0A067SC35_GALM3|nr:hypothetical protein GALMADRAFT_146415 [Galerina marginata CBS 339.88]